MKSRIIIVAVAAIAVTAANANALIMNDFSTSFSIATNFGDIGRASISSLTPNINQTQARFFGAADGGNVDLLVEIKFPNGDPNTYGTGRTVGLAGPGLAFNSYFQSPKSKVQSPMRGTYEIDYTFVDSGTDNPVTIDQLSFGLKDLDENRGSIGEKNILIDARATGATEILTPGGVNVVNGTLRDIGGSMLHSASPTVATSTSISTPTATTTTP